MAKAKTPDAAESSVTVQYTARTHINHDLVDYFDGDPIELDEITAAQLLAVNAIEITAA